MVNRGSATADLVITGVMFDGGLTKAGLGTMTLGGANTFTGGVTINAGILQLGNAGALNGTTPNVVTFGPASTGALNLNGISVTISGLATSVPVVTPVVRNAFSTPATLTVQRQY